MTDYLGLLRTNRRTDADCVKSGICGKSPQDGEPYLVKSGESGKSPEVDEPPALQWVHVDGRTPVEESTPPKGWSGDLCPGCQWPDLCRVLGPRGPHLPGGPCAAWPDPGVLETAANMAALADGDWRDLIAAVSSAYAADPYIAHDRAALAVARGWRRMEGAG